MYLRRPLCVFCLLFTALLTGLLYISGEKNTLTPNEPSITGRHLGFEGTVEGIDEKNDRLVLQIKNISISDSNILLYPENLPKDKIHIGSRIRAEGSFSLFDEACNKGQFDSRMYYGARGYGYVVYDGKIKGISASYDHIRDYLYHIKESTKAVYEHYLEREEYGVVEALVLADRNELDRDIKERYRNAGISHILALSGLHIVTLGFMMFGFLKRLRFNPYLSGLLSVAVMLLYCIMTGMPVSAVRAVIMFVLSVAALLVRRTYDLRTASAAAALIMLIINPDRIYDAGFLLSFSSVLGIGVIYPGIRELLMQMFGKTEIRMLHRSGNRAVRMTMSLLRTLVFSTALQLTVLPFTMWFFYQLPAYGVLVNLIVVPLAGALLLFSIAVGIVGSLALYVNGIYPGGEMIVMPAVYITRGILKLYEGITGYVCEIPGSIIITGRPRVWQIVIYYIVLTAAAAGGYILKIRERKLVRLMGKGKAAEKAGSVKVRLKHCAAGFMLSVAAGLIILFLRFMPGFELSALDVGQGQCFVIHGRNVPSVVYDCGSTDEKTVGEYRLIPYLKYNGISEIDTIFVSHLDSDHVSGINELLLKENTGISVRRILISGTGQQKECENYAKLVTAAKKKGVPVYAMSVGDSVRWDDLSVLCLAPDPEVSVCDSDINEGSLVLSVEYSDKSSADTDKKFRALFTGDISRETEELLVGRYKGRGIRHDYLQVAHHGSRFSASEEFIKAVSPSVAVISAGKNNRYGHPHKETMELLENSSIKHTYVTFRDGETDCDVDRKGLHIFLFK